MAQYRSHTLQTIEYMDEYLRKFHDNLHIFSKFQATKKDHQSAKQASRELAVDQREACQGKLEEYFQISTTKRKNMATKERRERQQVVQEVLSQVDFHFPKIHLLSHYNTQIRNFGSLHQYLTEVTEAVHKPLKGAYRRSNHVNATEQILDMINGEHVLRIRALNIEACSRELQLDRQILDRIRAPNNAKWAQGGRWVEEIAIDQMNSKYATLGGKQDSRDPENTRMGTLAERLLIPELTQYFYEYLRVNMGLTVGSVSLAQVAHFPMHYYSKLCVEIPQFQGQGIEMHKIW